MFLKGFLIFFFGVMGMGVTYAQIPIHLPQLVVYEPPKVNILLKRELRKNQFEIKGFDLRINGQRSEASVLPKWSSYRVTYNPSYQQWVATNQKTKSSLRLKSRKLTVEGEELFYDGSLMPRNFEVHTKYSNLYIVEVKDLESYLAGVVPSEMPASWPLEALKSQVVASRTYALYQRYQNRKKLFHIESTTQDQVYKSHSGLSTNFKKKVNQAIMQTRGLILTQAGEVLKAYYHADCGGQTEEPYRVWSGSKSIGTVKDISCPLSPHGQWTLKLSEESLSQKLAQHLKIKNSGFRDFKINSFTPSRRVKFVNFHYDNKLYQLSANDLRQVLGYGRLKSAKFKMIKNKNKWSFWGQGHGHGVGMCQWGTRFLAGRGVNYNKILQHYYPKAKIEVWRNLSKKTQVAQLETKDQ